MGLAYRKSFWRAVLAVAFLSVILVVAPAEAAQNGASCKKAGVTVVTKGVTYACTKRSNGKLKWVQRPVSRSSGYQFTSEGLRTGVTAVHPRPFTFNGTVLLFTSGGIYQSADGLNFAPQQGALPNGSSFSIVTLSGGLLRMYYLKQPSGAVGSATSTDALNWSIESGTRIQLNQFAVPRVVAISTGGFRMYYNQPAISGGVMLSAHSDDGLTFTPEAGERLSSPGVTWGDPAVIEIAAGSWLMATSNIPNADPATRAQEIYLATSSDGLTWSVDSQPIITNAARQVANPSFFDLGGGRYRIYYNSLNGPPPHTNSDNFVGSGIIAKNP